MHSDEFTEWVEIDEGYPDGRPPEVAFGFGALYLVCPDCLADDEQPTPEEWARYFAVRRAMRRQGAGG